MYSLGGGGYKATGSGAGYGASGLVAMVGERSDGERESSVRDGRAGGETGIRTLDTLSSIHAFQACAFSHSAISPWGNRLAEAPIGTPRAKSAPVSSALRGAVSIVTYCWTAMGTGGERNSGAGSWIAYTTCLLLAAAPGSSRFPFR